MRKSLNVAKASAPRTVYAINAMAKRLIIPPKPLATVAPPSRRLAGQRPTLPQNSIWCTGKDSNLRTSLGGTDLQSVGFNHSPTCAKTRRVQPPFQQAIPRTADRSSTLLLPVQQSFSLTRLSEIRLSQTRETKNRAYGLPREDHYTPECFRMECVGKTCCAATCRVLLSAGNSLLEFHFRTLVRICWSWRRDLNP